MLSCSCGYHQTLSLLAESQFCLLFSDKFFSLWFRFLYIYRESEHAHLFCFFLFILISPLSSGMHLFVNTDFCFSSFFPSANKCRLRVQYLQLDIRSHSLGSEKILKFLDGGKWTCLIFWNMCLVFRFSFYLCLNLFSCSVVALLFIVCSNTL